MFGRMTSGTFHQLENVHNFIEFFKHTMVNIGFFSTIVLNCRGLIFVD